MAALRFPADISQGWGIYEATAGTPAAADYLCIWDIARSEAIMRQMFGYTDDTGTIVDGDFTDFLQGLGFDIDTSGTVFITTAITGSPFPGRGYLKLILEAE